jgi:tRNA-Thr(GGU) m(6)t(6)A37 methyltransferase TsaA
LIEAHGAPRQPDEGAPPASIEVAPEYRAGLAGLSPGDAALVFTWLHLADRDVLTVHPRGDLARPEVGVFATRSPSRPNPIGLHLVRIARVTPDGHVEVDALEAVDGTPVLDIKPVLGSPEAR